MLHQDGAAGSFAEVLPRLARLGVPVDVAISDDGAQPIENSLTGHGHQAHGEFSYAASLGNWVLAIRL